MAGHRVQAAGDALSGVPPGAAKAMRNAPAAGIHAAAETHETCAVFVPAITLECLDVGAVDVPADRRHVSVANY